VRVLLADGDRLVRAALRQLLEVGSEIAVAGEAASGREAVALACGIRPDVVVINARLPDLNIVEATRLITGHPALAGVRVLILSDGQDDEDLFAALRVGATGVLTLGAAPAELLEAVRVLASGGARYPAGIARGLIDRFVASEPVPQCSVSQRFDDLTAREREVVALVAQGLTNREIAARLVVSTATAKTHVSRAMVKLHAHDRSKLVAVAYQTGLARSAIRRRGDEAGSASDTGSASGMGSAELHGRTHATAARSASRLHAGQ
jgi:DNA-binding NarL/FixJ family response regulator